MIEVAGLTKYYGVRRAIDSLTFNARHGEIVGFLGPNGAGKTTTMRILTGYIPPTSGKAEIGGFDIIDKSLDARRIIGYMPETVPLYPDMTVFDYLKFMADLRHLAEPEKRVNEALEMVKMTDRAKGYISNLSKGMRQRVGLAQALLHKPQVLILDEPTIGLDPAQIIEVRRIIQELGRDRTILLSTHILSEAQQVCDRVLIINKGRIVAEDSTQGLQSRLGGSQRAYIKTLSHAEEALEIIKATQGVLSATMHRDERIEFTTAPNVEARPEIIRRLVNQGLNILEVKAETMSLEDIFLELTKDEPEDPAIQEIIESGEA